MKSLASLFAALIPKVLFAVIHARALASPGTGPVAAQEATPEPSGAFIETVATPVSRVRRMAR